MVDMKILMIQPKPHAESGEQWFGGTSQPKALSLNQKSSSAKHSQFANLCMKCVVHCVELYVDFCSCMSARGAFNTMSVLPR